MPVYKDKERGSWFYVYNYTDEQGKARQKKKRNFKTKKLAAEALRKLEIEFDEGTYVAPVNITFKTYFKDWIEYKKLSLTNNTIALYEYSMKSHILPSLGHILLTRIKPQHIQKFISNMHEKGLADHTLRRIFNIANACLNYAVKIGDLPSNPAAKVEKPKISPKEMKVWTVEQIRQFLAVSRDHRLYCAFNLAIMTGLRKGEILGLRWKDVDLEKQILYVNQTLQQDSKTLRKGAKTNSSIRPVTFSENTKKALFDHKKKQEIESDYYGLAYKDLDLVIRSENGSPYNHDNLTRVFNYLINKAGLPKIRFHDLRHTHASLMIAQNEPMKLIAERLGHSKITTTVDTYGHLLPNMQYDASNRLDKTIFGGI